MICKNLTKGLLILGEFPEIVDKHRNNEIQKKTENSWELKFSLND